MSFVCDSLCYFVDQGAFSSIKIKGWKLSYPDEEQLFLFGTKPKMKYDPLDNDDCETVNGSKTVERPLKGPLYSRLCVSNLATPDHLICFAWCVALL